MGTLSRRNRKISFTPLSAGYGRAVRRFGLGAELHRAYVRRHTRQSTRLKALRGTDAYKAADTESRKRQEEDVLAKCATEYTDDVDEVQHEWRVRQSERGRDVGFIDSLRLKPGWAISLSGEDADVVGVITNMGDQEKVRNELGVFALRPSETDHPQQSFKPDLPPRPQPPDQNPALLFEFLPAFPELLVRGPDKIEEPPVSLAPEGSSVTPQPGATGSEKKPRKKRAIKSTTPAAKKQKKITKSGGAEWEQFTTVISAPPTPEGPPRAGSTSTLSSAPDSPTTESVFPELSPFTDTPSSHRRRGPKPSTTPGEDPSKNFVCTICHSRFKRREHLKRHMTTLHTADKPFVCGECGKKCSREDNLTQHFKTRHAGGNGNGEGSEGHVGRGGEDEDMDYSDEDDGGGGGGGGSDTETLDENQRLGELEVRSSPQKKKDGKEVDWEKENWMAIDILREAAAAVAAQEMENGGPVEDGDVKMADQNVPHTEKDVNEMMSFLGAAGGEPPLEKMRDQTMSTTSDPKEMMVVLKYSKSEQDRDGDCEGMDEEEGGRIGRQERATETLARSEAGKSADQKMVSVSDDKVRSISLRRIT